MCCCTEEDVTSGGIIVMAKLYDIPLYNGTLDLCSLSGQVGLPCPIKAGMHSLMVSAKIPDLAPTASYPTLSLRAVCTHVYTCCVLQGVYSGHGVINDQNNKEVACGSGSFKLE